ncbi:LysR family transcriptional regulator [Ottowia thiooxydans]|uniref:LysR family transcriptional regulator n=1 Tax=Ottowia thiooxydans TaxID=219182 RepID=UPI000424BD1F|nr:LysR substrate-binding domain-containing protein [Ottowia thiooxydans]
MDLKQLEHFVAVVERGSISRAAAALHLAQPSVSKQMTLLEKSLGQRLLERTGRGVTPTEAGRALLGHARTMLNAAAQARLEITDMCEEPTGKVVVGLPNRVALGLCVPLLKEFRKRMPKAMLSVQEGLSVPLRDGLIQGRIDIAMMFDPVLTPLLSFETVMREPLMLFAPANHRMPSEIAPKDIKKYALVLPTAPNPIRNLVDTTLLPYDLALNIIAEVGAVQSALTMVEAGIACSILPESALHISRRPHMMQRIPIGPPVTWNTLMLAQPVARPASRLVQETAKLLRTLDFRTLDKPS